MLSFLFFTFLFYVLFKLVFDFIVPLYRTTKKVKQSFRAMQEQMQEQQNHAGAYQSAQGKPSEKKQEPLGDYIDFEEVKD